MANPVKTLDEKSPAFEIASNIRVLTEILDATSEDNNKHKKDLVDTLVEIMQTSLIEEDSVFGTFKINMGEGQGIVEVPFSVSSGPLSPEELSDLSPLTKPTFDTLFEEKDVMDNVNDHRALLSALLKLDDKDLKKLFKVGSGKVTIEVKKVMDGIKTTKAVVARTGFFGNLALAMDQSTERNKESKTISAWLEKRVKGSVRLGNRAEA